MACEKQEEVTEDPAAGKVPNDWHLCHVSCLASLWPYAADERRKCTDAAGLPAGVLGRKRCGCVEKTSNELLVE